MRLNEADPSFYTWLCETLKEQYETVRLLKQNEKGSVRLIRHRKSGARFILRSYCGSAEVYRSLLSLACPYLPRVYELASDKKAEAVCLTSESGSAPLMKDGRAPEEPLLSAEQMQNIVLEEYVEGDNMDVMLKEALFSVRETRRIARELCEALYVLHQMGAVHRDVKPSNVILRGSGAVLIDFDAARFHKEGLQSDTTVLGTTGFAAPEQYGMSQSDSRADIYALGILINVMLTGAHPSKKLAGGRLGRIVTKCTQVNPKKRYQTVLHLLDEL